MIRTKKRDIIVTCEDKECYFKNKMSGNSKVKDECCIMNADAVTFLHKFGITTCEFGCDEEDISVNKAYSEIIRRRLKNRGLLKG